MTQVEQHPERSTKEKVLRGLGIVGIAAGTGAVVHSSTVQAQGPEILGIGSPRVSEKPGAPTPMEYELTENESIWGYTASLSTNDQVYVLFLDREGKEQKPKDFLPEEMSTNPDKPNYYHFIELGNVGSSLVPEKTREEILKKFEHAGGNLMSFAAIIGNKRGDPNLAKEKLEPDTAQRSTFKVRASPDLQGGDEPITSEQISTKVAQAIDSNPDQIQPTYNELTEEQKIALFKFISTATTPTVGIIPATPDAITADVAQVMDYQGIEFQDQQGKKIIIVQYDTVYFSIDENQQVKILNPEYLAKLKPTAKDIITSPNLTTDQLITMVYEDKLPERIKKQALENKITFSSERMGYVRMNPETGREEVWRSGMSPNKKNEKTGAWEYENEEAGWMTETDRRTFDYIDNEGNPGQVTLVIEMNTTLGIGTRGYKWMTFGPDIDTTFPRFAHAVFGPDMNGKTIHIPWVPGKYTGKDMQEQKLNGNFVIAPFVGKDLSPTVAFGGKEVGNDVIERAYAVDASLQHTTDEYRFGGTISIVLALVADKNYYHTQKGLFDKDNLKELQNILILFNLNDPSITFQDIKDDAMLKRLAANNIILGKSVPPRTTVQK